MIFALNLLAFFLRFFCFLQKACCFVSNSFGNGEGRKEASNSLDAQDLTWAVGLHFLVASQQMPQL